MVREDVAVDEVFVEDAEVRIKWRWKIRCGDPSREKHNEEEVKVNFSCSTRNRSVLAELCTCSASPASTMLRVLRLLYIYLSLPQWPHTRCDACRGRNGNLFYPPPSHLSI